LEVMDMMTKIAREYNQTMIIVSHDPEIADYADKIITIQDGDVLKIEKNIEERREVIYEKTN
ncbi:MAG: ABC transporter ATP-binding protein, partial [Cellulosilyticum sp.]|nr:ABC transporter ATP-binding protein [Cellulosilyticum sp.]